MKYIKIFIVFTVLVNTGNTGITILEPLTETKFFRNTVCGILLTIRGKVRNDYSDARGFISIRGCLYLKNGQIAQEEVVYCGNTFIDNELQSSDKPTIRGRLNNKFGDDKDSFMVPPGGVVPFTIVFFDLPQNLAEYSVEVVDSRSMTQLI